MTCYRLKISCDIRGCGSISFSPSVYAQNCTPTTNAKCSCRKGFLCSNEDCSQCAESRCPAGELMKWTGKGGPLRSRAHMAFADKRCTLGSTLHCTELTICMCIYVAIMFYVLFIQKRQTPRNVGEELADTL